MRLLIAALICLPSLASAHDRVIGGVIVPNGYRVAWDDGRVNPNRGPRTATGDAQMAAIWTDDVPMELVNPGDPTRGLAGPASYVIAGRYHSLSEAQAAAAALDGSHVAQGTQTGIYRVVLGPYANRDAARAGLDAARDADFRHPRPQIIDATSVR
ncbi:MAG: SPOR domain-containing protein [Pseudomonadota bacterium]